MTDASPPGGLTDGRPAPDADLFRLLADNVADYALYVVDADRRVLTWNPAAERLLGYSEAEILGQRADLFFTPEDRAAGGPEEELREALETGRGDNDRWHVRKDGRRFWSAGVLTPLRDKDGRLHGFCKIMRDQTALKLAEEERRQAEGRLRTLADNLPNGAVYQAIRDTPDSPTRFLYVSGGVERIFGVSAEEATADPASLYGLIHPDDVPLVAAEAEAIRTGGQYDVRFRSYRRSGELIRVHCRSAPRRLPDGRLVWEGVVLDVTEQARAEERLRESEQLFRAYFESSTVGMAQADPQTRRLVRVNDAFARLTGYSMAELAEMSVADLNHPDDRERDEANFREVVGDGRSSYDIEKRYVRKGGETIWVRTAGTVLRDEAGRPSLAAAVVLDITGRKRAEDERRRQHDLTRSITDNATTAIFLMDAEGRTTFMNPAAEAMTGFSFEELEGRVLHDRVHHRRLDGRPFPMAECPIGSSVLSKRTLRAQEEAFVRRDGSFYPVRCSASPILRDGELAGIVLEATDVAEEKRAEAALRASEERFRGLMDQAPFSVQVLAADGRTVRVNRAWEELWGVTADRIGGYNILDDAQLEAKGVLPHLRRAFAGEPVELPEIAYDPNATIPDITRHAEPVRWVSAVAYPIKDAAGAVREVVLVHEDVTARRRAEAAVRESEEWLRLALEAGRMGTWEWDVRTGRVRWSEGLEEIHGLAPGSFDGTFETYRKLIHPEDLPQLQAAIEESLKSGAPYEADFRFVRADGSVGWMAGRGKAFYAATGEPLRMVGVGIDVTDRKRAEAAARESEARFRSVVESDMVGIGFWDADGSITDANDALLAMLGRDRGDLADGRLRWPDITPPEYADADARAFAETRERGRCTPYEKEWVRKDGSRLPVLLGGAAFGEDRTRGAFFALDISARRHAEGSLRFLAGASAALAALSDPESTFQKVASVAVPAFADWAAVDLIGEAGERRRVAVAHADPAKVRLAAELDEKYPARPDDPAGVGKVLRTGDPELVPDIPDSLLEAVTHDAEHLRIARELGLKSYVCAPMLSQGRVAGAITFVSAESGRRYGEADLRTAEDLARRAATAIENARLYEQVRDADRRKDEFLAMLAHELRNPLAPIRSGLDLLKMTGAEPDVVEVMSEQVGQVVRLVDDLLDVSRILRGKVELKREPADLSAVLRRAAETVRPRTEEHRQRLVVSLPEEPVRLNADPVRLTQVVSNLLNNASKYTDDGGEVRLEAFADGGEVVIRVSDTGIGIEPSLLPKVFDLFTQADQALDRSQGGLGIGLTVVKSLVEMHGGTVEVTSEGVGRGATFTVRLPVSLPAEARGDDAPADAPARSRRVLVVDDNAPAAKLLGRLLEKLGDHAIRTAHDGRSALESAAEFRPDLILLDIGLPRMDGYEVARRLRAMPEFRDVLLVALTGYGTADDRRRSIEAGFDDHVTKPPGVDLLRKVLAHPKLNSGR